MQQPATVIVAPPPAPVQQACCYVGPNASTHVKGARGSAIAIIVVHVVVIIAAGWWIWTTWLASLIAFIMGGIQLCMFNKCTYITAGSLYIVGCIFDLVAMAAWIAASNAVNDATDDAYDDWGDHLGWFALPPALGALSFLIGCVYSFLAACNWAVSGAPDAMGMRAPAGGAQVTQAAHAVQMTHAKSQPPPYSGSV